MQQTAEMARNLSVMVGRQPILDRRRQVFGYELLFGAPGGTAPGADADNPATGEGAETTAEEAAAHVIADGVMSVGLETLTHGRRAFVELTPEFLGRDVVKVLPPDKVVVQVSCDAAADAAVIQACRELKRQGYALALSHYTDAHAALLPHATFVKVDVAGPGGESMEPVGSGGAAVIANGVDAVVDFERAVRRGCSHFQGFFFERPSTIQARAIPRGQLGYLRLLCALNDPNLSLSDLEDLMKRDASLCYRLLRTVNSAGFAQSHEVTSIRHALLLLGRDTIRRWASLWVMTDLGAEAPAELTIMASIRGRFCELLASHLEGPDASGEGFLLGMCSCLDVILERPLASIVEELPLTTDTIAALLGRDNDPRRLLDCAIAYERGHWAAALRLATSLGLERTLLPSAHGDALTWAHRMQVQNGRH
jgi:EAL and modified HD-GYP domain-containing signal transduction protein